MVTILILLIGAAILVAGLYYLKKAGDDRESRKVYGIAALIGAVVLVAAAVKALVFGL
nr:hypothetical protein [uncultured Agathobaculum sp.]